MCLLINKETFLINKNTVFILLFLFILFFSSFFTENMFISLKRFVIVFVPFFIIFQTFQNHKNLEFIDKAEKLLLYLIILLCLYSFIVFSLDLLYGINMAKDLSSRINFIVSTNLDYGDNDINNIEAQFYIILQKIIIILNQYELSDQQILNYEAYIKQTFEQLKTENLSKYTLLTNTFQSSQLILEKSMIEPWQVSNNFGIGQVYTSR